MDLFDSMWPQLIIDRHLNEQVARRVITTHQLIQTLKGLIGLIIKFLECIELD